MTDKTQPHLENKTAFVAALKDYQVSAHAREVLARTPLVVLSGLAGGGRNTVINKLAEQGGYIFAISDTTRPPKLRGGRMEQDGVDYYFRSEADMLRDIQNGEFIEAEIIHNQQVSGTSIRELERVSATGKIPMHDFEYQGANNVARIKPDAVVIGLLPPSYEEWLRRFRERETITDLEFRNRLTTAKNVLENMLAQPYFKLVINADLEQCMRDLRHIVEDGHYSATQAGRGRAIATELLRQVSKALD